MIQVFVRSLQRTALVWSTPLAVVAKILLLAVSLPSCTMDDVHTDHR